MQNPETSITIANTPNKRRRSMAIAAFGTVVEWYDFSIFFYVSTYLAATFYAPYEGSQLLALATGAVGFLFRPLGAMVFGHLGERIGRKETLVISAGLIAISMFGIALMPSFEVLGVWAAVGVTFFRCLAGFSVGAEYTGIMVYLMESATAKNRGFTASWAAANSEVGALLAVGLSTVLALSLPVEIMGTWGWRSLFVFGGLLALLMIPLRRFMNETETFTERTSVQEEKNEKSPLWTAITRYPRTVLVVFLISTVGSATYFLNITYLPTYLETVTKLEPEIALSMGTAAALAAIVVTPFIGWLADVWNRRQVFIAVLVLILAGSIPAYLMLGNAGGAVVLIGVVLLAVPAAGWSAVAAAAVPEQFSSNSRFAGMAIGYNAAVALFGGLSPLVVTWLIEQTENPMAPAYYAAILCAVAGIPAVMMMRNMARVPIERVDATEPG